MELPPHSESDDPSDSAIGRKPAPAHNRAGVAIAAVLITLVVLVVILHLTGIVGPGAQ